MHKKGNILQQILRLEPFIKKGSRDNWVFIIVIVFLAVIKIELTFSYDKKLLHYQEIEQQSIEINWGNLTWKSNLDKLKLQSNIEKIVKPMGLVPSQYPPKKIIIKPKKLQ